MQGKIIKGIAGFYYVYVVGSGIYECKAKGIFRKDKQKPLVGDNVEIAVLSEEEKTGNIDRLLPRKNELIRPAVANVDQAMVIFAAASPKPNLNLLDRFLIMMERQNIPTLICFNKCDLVSGEEQRMLREIYEPCGYPLLFVSAANEQGITDIQEQLRGKTTTVAGPSGVGKSSLINLLQQEVEMETGAISEKIERGRHTTRHSQLIYISEDTFIMDTPGFTSLSMEEFEKESLWEFFPEFVPCERECRFVGCSHISEPDCGVRTALAQGKISASRYENYRLIFEEIKNRRVDYSKKHK